MSRGRRLPDDPIRFFQACLRQGRLFWTYHVNMRLAGRFISRETILGAVDTFELVEAYPDDKYLPSYLLLGRAGTDAFHVLFATDVEADNVRVITAYRPDAAEWGGGPNEVHHVWGRPQADSNRFALQGKRPRHCDPQGAAGVAVREVPRILLRPRRRSV